MQNLKCAKIYRNAENDMQKALKYKYVLRMHVFEEAKSLFKLQVFSLFSFFFNVRKNLILYKYSQSNE